MRGVGSDGKYNLLVLTRDRTSDRAQKLLDLGNNSLLQGSFADEEIVRGGLTGFMRFFRKPSAGPTAISMSSGS